jgi:hypothetical protein
MGLRLLPQLRQEQLLHRCEAQAGTADARDWASDGAASAACFHTRGTRPCQNDPLQLVSQPSAHQQQ